MQSDKISEQKDHFLNSISGDSAATKLWKYRYLLANEFKVGERIKTFMLEVAIKYRLIGEYELIHEALGIPAVKEGKYNEIREEMISSTNKLKTDALQYEATNNMEETVKCYFKIGELYSEFGVHEEAVSYYSKVFRGQTDKIIIKREAYFSRWAQETLYHEGFTKFTELGMFVTCQIEDPKKIDTTLSLLQDIKFIEMRKKKVFENLLAGTFTIQDIISNRFCSLSDLGFLYSLMALAYKDRDFLKKDVKWSSKMEIFFLQNDYRKLFSELDKFYSNHGCHNPIINMTYGECFLEIKKRVLSQILNSYQNISFQKIEELSTIKEGEVILFLRENRSLPFLIDPITRSVVYYEKSIALYDEALQYYNIIKEKLDEKRKILLMESKGADEEGAIGMMMGRRKHRN